MKKTTEHQRHAEMRAEYDFAAMKAGVRGKYNERYRRGTNVVLLDADVAEAFPTESAVNEALRSILTITRALRRPGGSPARAAKTGNAQHKRRKPRT